MSLPAVPGEAPAASAGSFISSGTELSPSDMSCDSTGLIALHSDEMGFMTPEPGALADSALAMIYWDESGVLPSLPLAASAGS